MERDIPFNLYINGTLSWVKSCRTSVIVICRRNVREGFTIALWINPTVHTTSPRSCTRPSPCRLFEQVNLALLIASTSVVPSRLRGRLAGLYNMAESLGRSLGPVGFATVFAWSISDSSYFWVDNRFMFLAAALSMALVAALAWGTITNEHMVNSG